MHSWSLYSKPWSCRGVLAIILPTLPPSTLLQISIHFEASFEPFCLAHPDTYINKVVVGGADGSLQLVNFVTGQVVHTFKGW
jgi:hypothetical protein